MTTNQSEWDEEKKRAAELATQNYIELCQYLARMDHSERDVSHCVILGYS